LPEAVVVLSALKTCLADFVCSIGNPRLDLALGLLPDKMTKVGTAATKMQIVAAAPMAMRRR
jgi:hypothetical protein